MLMLAGVGAVVVILIESAIRIRSLERQTVFRCVSEMCDFRCTKLPESQKLSKKNLEKLTLIYRGATVE